MAKAKSQPQRDLLKGPPPEYVAALELVAVEAANIVGVEPVDIGYVSRQLALKAALVKLSEAKGDGT